MSNKSGQSDSLLLNIAFNIIIPTLILINLSTSEYLGTKLAVAVALAFPIIYGLKDFIMIKKLNAFSALGVISILLTGGISLLELNPIYIAIKEAAIPNEINTVEKPNEKTIVLIRTTRLFFSISSNFLPVI